jgi:hypothetical protein
MSQICLACRPCCKRLGWIVVLLFSFVLTGCDLARAKHNGEIVLARHFLLLSTNGYNAALDDYGDQFFRTTGKAEWSNALCQMSYQLGTFQRYTIRGWRVLDEPSGISTGTTVILQCRVNYSKYPADEVFTLFKGSSMPRYKIIGHRIQSTALGTQSAN